MNPCRNCDALTDTPWEVCPQCYRDPDTNNCEECGVHSPGIPYPYVCGWCLDRPKNVVWVIESEGTLGSTNTGRLREALAVAKIPTLSVDPKYFTDDLPEVEGGIPEGMVPIYYGSTTLRDKLVAAGRPGVFFDPERFAFPALEKGYGYNLLNYDSRVITAGEFLAEPGDPEELLFIRPTEDSKSLTGAVGSRREWKESIQISMNNTRGPNPRTMIQVGEPKNIEYEWRMFVVDGRVVASSQYRAHGHRNVSAEVPYHVIWYAEDMARLYRPARVFVMDVCELSPYWGGALRVVETNCFNCSGVYLAHVTTIVRWVSKFVEQEGQSP